MKDVNGQIPVDFYMKLISERCRSCADDAFRQKGLTGTQAQYLEFLQQKGGESTQKDMEVYFGVSHPTVIGVLHRLQEKGFVEIHVDPENRRSRIVHLTKKAKAVNTELERGRAGLERQIFQGFSQQEIRALRHYLQRIYENLSGPPGHCGPCAVELDIRKERAAAQTSSAEK